MDSGSSITVDATIDGVLMVAAAAVPTYFDGDTPGYGWCGAPHASASMGPNAVVMRGQPFAAVTLAGVAGDIPAEARVIVHDAAVQSRRHLEIGLEQRYYNATAPAALLLDSDDLSTSGLAGAGNTRTGAFDPNATGNNVIRATLRSSDQALLSTGNQPHVGSYRVKARVYATATAARLRLSWQDGDGPFRANAYTSPAVANAWCEVDLGIITITPTLAGSQRWVGKILGYSTSGTPTLDVDCLQLVPIEAYCKARGVVPTSGGVLVAEDQFTGMSSGAALNARVAPTGQSWATSGATTDFTAVDGPGVGQEAILRSATNQSTPRFALVGGSQTDVDVATDFRFSQPFGSTGDGPLRFGVVFRYTDATNYYAALLSVGTADAYSLQIFKVVAGSITILANTQYGFQHSRFYRLRVVAYTGGKIVATVSDGGAEVTRAQATDTTVTSGQAGLYDWHNDPGLSVTRYYDSFSLQGAPAEELVLSTGRRAELRYDGALREDVTGTYWGPLPVRGGRLMIPAAGDKNRVTRVVAKAAPRRRRRGPGRPDRRRRAGNRGRLSPPLPRPTGRVDDE